MIRTPAAAALSVLAIACVAVVLLLPFGGREQPALSYDSPYYVWRTRAVATMGLDVLVEVPTGGVPERPGFPVVGALIGAVTGSDALTVTIVLRAVAAIAIGLAAGALAMEALGGPKWTFAAFVVGLGTSAAVVGAAVGSLDQLLVEVLLMAAAAIVPLVIAGRRGLGTTGLVIAAAVATHWVFAGLFLLVVVGLAGLLLLVPITRGRTGSEIERGRALRVVAAAAIGAIVALLVLPVLPDQVPPAVGGKGNDIRLGAYELPLLLPLAGLGLVLRPRGSGRPARRVTIVLAGLWAAIVPVAFFVSAILPAPLKLFRVAPFALGVPLLATLGLVTLASLMGSRWGRGGMTAGALILIGGLAWTMGPPASTFTSEGTRAGRVAERMTQARAAGRYLTGVPSSGRPVVFVTLGAPRLLDRAVRSAVPPSLITDTWVFVGDAADLTAAGSGPDPDRLPLSEESRAWLADAWPSPPEVLSRDPIVIGIGPARGRAETATELAPGVAIVRGPEPSPSYRPPPAVTFPWVRLLVLTGIAVMLLAAVGSGWARSMLDVSTPAAIGLAPAVGLAVLVIAGTAAGRMDVSLGGPGGIALLVTTAGAGWAEPAIRRTFIELRRRSEERARGQPPL